MQLGIGMEHGHYNTGACSCIHWVLVPFILSFEHFVPFLFWGSWSVLFTFFFFKFLYCWCSGFSSKSIQVATVNEQLEICRVAMHMDYHHKNKKLAATAIWRCITNTNLWKLLSNIVSGMLNSFFPTNRFHLQSRFPFICYIVQC